MQPDMPQHADDDRLHSWKEIAAHFRRDERTVRRWEKLGLPVHRHHHRQRSAVYAYRHELDAWWESRGEKAEARSEARHTRTPQALQWAGLTLAALSATLLFWNFATRRAQSSSVLPAPKPVASVVNDVAHLAFDPEGHRIAFSWTGEQGASTDIYVMSLDGSAPHRVSGGPAAECCPAWSPDGKQIAFVRNAGARSGIYTVPAQGGPERKLFALPGERLFDLAWTKDGRHLVFATRGSEQEPFRVHVLNLETLSTSPLTSPSGETGDTRFSLSPDGKTLAFIRQQSPPGSSIRVIPISGGQERELLAEDSWIGHVAWANDGRSVIFSSGRGGGSRLWRLPISGGGQPELLSFAGQNAWYPALAAQKNRLAFVEERETTNLVEVPLNGARGAPARAVPLGPTNRRDGSPRFSPDGTKLVFESDRSGTMQIWVSRADGSRPVQLTSYSDQGVGWPAWSADGQRVVYSHRGKLQVIPAEGGQPVPLNNPEYAQGPVWSHDGNWIYFYSQGAAGQIWKIPSAGGAPIQVTRNGGLCAAESQDGTSLYYTKVNAAGIWRLPVAGGAESLVVDGFHPQLCGYWALTRDGIYWLNPAPKRGSEIAFFDFATRRSRSVAPFAGTPGMWQQGMTLSPDERRLVLTDVKLRGSEIMLVENFR